MIRQFIKFLRPIIDLSTTRNAYMTGSSHVSLMRQNYSKIKDINDLDYKIFSQAGEDGIIDYLLFSLGIKKPRFIEIGVGDYREANTRFVFERTNCQGLIIDVTKDLEQKVKNNTVFWKGDLTVVEKEIDSEFIKGLNNTDSDE